MKREKNLVVMVLLIISLLWGGCLSIINPVTGKIGPSYDLPLKIPAIYTTKSMAQIFDLQEDDSIPILEAGVMIEIIPPENLMISMDMQNYFENNLILDLLLFYEIESDLPLGARMNFYFSNDKGVKENYALKIMMGIPVEKESISLVELLSIFSKPVYFSVDLEFLAEGIINGYHYLTPQVYLVAIMKMNQ